MDLIDSGEPSLHNPLFVSLVDAFVAGRKEGRWVSLLIVSETLLSAPASLINGGWSPAQLPMVTGIMLDRRAGLPKDAPWKSVAYERPQSHGG